ncbi:hypothetical protein C0993_005820 [Termitomyces sp. T159_Od127]|nr:hypothetical protein C0993_005820 [Termitomyces sp. T159_Od127]
METSEGRTVEGIAKDKEVAQTEYESAIHANQLAGPHLVFLVFTISVGSIPAYTNVKIYLEYVMNLANDDNADEIRFQLSSGIGQRYGAQPDELASAFRPTEQTRIKITCEVQMAGRIQEIVSPSHGRHIYETRYQTSGRPSRRRTKIDYRSHSFLDRDFVLIISSKDLDSPRCFAELRRIGSQTTLALQMSLIPKNLYTIDSQEYIFVVDRSGSMSTGSPQRRIDIAKDTLTLLLRMLPASGTMFNMYIFDDDVESLSPRGLEYNEENLRKAVSLQFQWQYCTNCQSTYVDGIIPRGGTELHKAVRHILQARDLRMPTAVFLLTDGEVHGNDAIEAVRDAVAQAPKSAPLRVFTLGIGDQVSTAICEGISTAGNGVCLYAVQAESIIGKCARLFRAGRTRILRDVTIDWGIPDECLRTLSSTSSGQIAVPSLAIQQAPTQVNNVHSGTLTIVSAIIQLQDISIPRTVYLHGRLDNNGSPFEPLPIPVETVRLDGANKGLHMIHTLTAWRLIKEHEGKLGQLPATMIPGSEDDIRKAVIISLGERYQLVSQYTSFIAIDSGQNARRHFRIQATSRDNLRQPDATSHDQGKNSLSFLQTTCDLLSGLFWLARNPPLLDSRTIPGSWSTSSSSDSDETEDNNEAESDASAGSYTTFSTLSSLNSCDCSDCSVPSSLDLQPRLSPEEEEIQRQPSPRIEFRNLNSNQVQRMKLTKPLSRVSPNVIKLVRLQDFNGSFSPDCLRNISGIGSAVDEATKLDVDAKVWATALAIAFMQKEMVDQRALQNDLVAKAREFLDATAGLDSKKLLRHATQVLASL